MSPIIYIIFGVYRLRPAINFQITAVYQLRPRLLRVRTLVASRGQFSGITVVNQSLDRTRVILFREMNLLH